MKMSGLKIKYFVLDPKSKYAGDPHAHASRRAMMAYANLIEKEDHKFFQDLLNWVNDEEEFEAKLNLREVRNLK